MPDHFKYYVGVDWAAERHQVCVLNDGRDLIAERVVEHTGPGLAEFVAWLIQLTHHAPDSVAVSIEIPRGAVVEILLEHGFQVFAINPKQLDRFRDRHTVAGAKDDRRDAFVLADSLRTDLPLFKPLQIDDPVIIHLRELSRLDDNLRLDHNQILNRFRDQIARYFPQLLQLSAAIDEPWIWELFELAPLPAQAAKLSAQRIEKVLRRARIRRLSAEDVRTALQSQGFSLAPGAAEASAEHALLLLPRLRLVHEQRAEVARRIDAILQQLAAPDGETRKHRDVTLLLSFPGIGRVIAATMLAEASQPLRERDYHALRAYGGTAPITKQSGKKRYVVMRQACSDRLRHAFYHWARVNAQLDPRSKEHYQQLRRAGHSHGRALRGLADRLLAVLVAILNTGVPYNANLRKSLQASAA